MHFGTCWTFTFVIGVAHLLFVCILFARTVDQVTNYWLPYHMQHGRIAEALAPDDIVSCHSFTENYEGQRRPFHVGVLCTRSSAWVAVIARYALP